MGSTLLYSTGTGKILVEVCCFIIRNVLFSGQSVPSRSAVLCRPLWTLAPPPSQGLGWDLKLHQICTHPVLNHPKSPFLWNWISWQRCTVPASQVSDHKVALMCKMKTLEEKALNEMYFYISSVKIIKTFTEN